MLIDNQKIKIKWGSKNKKYYEDKGYIFTKYGDEFFVDLQDLPESSDKIVKIKCDYCGEVINVKYNRYINAIKKYGNYYCYHCTHIRSLESRQEKIFAEFIDFCNRHDYIPITKKEEILNNNSILTYICKIHGEHSITVKTMKRDSECYWCARTKILKQWWDSSLEDRQNILYERALKICKNKGYKFLSKKEEITGYKSYIKYECSIHGIHKIRIGNLLAGKECPDCRRDNLRLLFQLSKNDVICRVEELGGELLNPNDYINQSEKNLIIRCPICGEPFTTSLKHFLQHGGQSCQKCRRTESIGERKIREYLELNQISYSQEYWFNDCRDIKPLRFDFYLLDLNTIIEFDGKQHFEEVQIFGKRAFEITKKHDTMKNNYCNANDIYLIRIPYWDMDNITEILNKKLIH